MRRQRDEIVLLLLATLVSEVVASGELSGGWIVDDEAGTCSAFSSDGTQVTSDWTGSTRDGISSCSCPYCANATTACECPDGVARVNDPSSLDPNNLFVLAGVFVVLPGLYFLWATDCGCSRRASKPAGQRVKASSKKEREPPDKSAEIPVLQKV